MAFLINCDNKGCFHVQAAQLDLSTNQVICVDCRGIIKNVTIFAKHQLKSLGQTTKNVKKQQPYAVKCEHCQIVSQPLLQDKIFKCSECNKELAQLSNSFKTMLQNVLGNEQK